MADVFENRRDLDPWRAKLWTLIEATPHLDWLLLTKRPEHVMAFTSWGKAWPRNVWIGTTVEDQKTAEERLPHLSHVPAAVRFISAEPLRGALQIQPWLRSTIDWVITGGESGPKARPSSPSWFRTLLSQCSDAGVPFHFKQWGDWVPGAQPGARQTATAKQVDDGTVMRRVGKKAAGRLLDGAMWDGLPQAKAA